MNFERFFDGVAQLVVENTTLTMLAILAVVGCVATYIGASLFGVWSAPVKFGYATIVASVFALFVQAKEFSGEWFPLSYEPYVGMMSAPWACLLLCLLAVWQNAVRDWLYRRRLKAEKEAELLERYSRNSVEEPDTVADGASQGGLDVLFPPTAGEAFRSATKGAGGTSDLLTSSW